MIKLYDDQVDLVGKIREAYRSHKHVCAVLPTGGGKTVIAAHISQLISKGKQVLFLVHRQELMDQACTTLQKAGLSVALCAANRKAGNIENAKVIVAMATTLVKREPSFLPKQPFFIIIDEAHHARAKTWEKVMGWWPDAFRLGLTATPQRLDGKGLGSMFEVLVEGATMGELVELQRLAPYRLRGPVEIYDRAQLQIRAGDFAKDSIDFATTEQVVGNVVDTIERYCAGMTTLLFSPSVRASKRFVAKMRERGINAAHVDGETPEKERKHRLQAWAGGDIQVISNYELFGEGVDAPLCQAVVMARPTKSLTVYLQQIGRSLRYGAGKKAEIFDLVGNCKELGLPDEIRAWTLEDQQRPKGKAPVKQCPECETLMPINLAFCPECGCEQPLAKKKARVTESTEMVDIKLESMSKEAKYNTLQTAARKGASDAILKKIIASLGYKPGYLYFLKKKVEAERKQREVLKKLKEELLED